MLLDFQIEAPTAKILYACLSSNFMIWVDKGKENLKNALSVNFHRIVVVP